MKLSLLTCTLLFFGIGYGQNYFQQEVNYKIDVTLVDSIHTLKGTIKIEYTNNAPEELKEIQIFTDDLIKKDKNTGVKSINVDFKKETFNLITNIKKINQYYKPFSSEYVIAKNLILSDIYEIQSSFVKERDKLQKSVEEKMNTIIKDPTSGIGIGFDPTIRNIFAVILANADVYVRLMKDVHRKAIQRSDFRKKENPFRGLNL